MKELVFILFCVYPSIVNCQQYSLEEKAIVFFCDSIGAYADSLFDTQIIFGGKIESEPSRVYDVAHCFNDINLLTYSYGNQPELDSLLKVSENKNQRKTSFSDYKCSKFRRNTLFLKKKYKMRVYSVNSYLSDKKVVEITLYHKFSGHLVIFAAIFDDNRDIIETCSRSLFID